MFYPTGLTALLTLGLLAERAFAVPASTPQSNASVPWGNCESFGINSTDPNLQCGFLEVPMDYHDDSAGTARLAVIKYTATVSKKQGTIFFNPGGPGDSGLQAIAGLGQAFIQGFQGAFDIASWDPRGVGYTFPGAVTCFDSLEEDRGFWNHTVVNYINETIAGRFNERDLEELYSQVDLTEQKFKDFTEHCRNGPMGPYLRYLGTSSTVRDLVSLGDAILGKGEPINYWGISYGTVIGFNFVNMFPERAGHVILDGVVDPTGWISFKLLRPSFTDTEKVYSGLTNACAVAGRAGCKIAEFVGDNTSGDDIKALLDFALDAALELYRGGIELPVDPGFLKFWLYRLLFFPTTWSGSVNNYLYQFVGFILQASRAHNITIGGGADYNVPSGGFTIDSSLLSEIGATSSPDFTSYTEVAIAGADNFNDGSTTIRDVFGIIVNATREVTPSFGAIWGPDYTSYGWPVRSVERLPPFTPKQLRRPVLVIGNSADPITPFANAQKAASLLGDNAFLLEQLGFGHTSIAQFSSCTFRVMTKYFVNSTLPEGRSAQCPVDDANLFPVLNGSTTVARRSNFLHR